MNDAETRDAYAGHLQSYPWDYFATVTFRKLHRDPLNAARRVWDAADKLGASRGFVAVERHKLDGVHVHALLRQLPHLQVPAKTHWRYMSKAFGRTSVEEPRDGMAAAAYCAKYVTKDHGLSGESFHYFGDRDSWLQDGSTWEY